MECRRIVPDPGGARWTWPPRTWTCLPTIWRISPSGAGIAAPPGCSTRRCAGILAAESLVCARIAAAAPGLAAHRHAERRVRRLARGETTQRSTLTPEDLIDRLQARGVEQLREEEHIWLIFDGSDLRKPHAQVMEALPQVKPLKGSGTIPGYRTLNAIGLGTGGKRGLLYHPLFSSTAPEFLSESLEARDAMRSVATALAPLGAEVTAILDAEFDDVADWAEVWDAGWHLLVRVQHRNRRVRRTRTGPSVRLDSGGARAGAAGPAGNRDGRPEDRPSPAEAPAGDGAPGGGAAGGPRPK